MDHSTNGFKNRFSPAERLLSVLSEGIRYFVGALAGLAADWLVWTCLFLATGMPVASQVVSRSAGAIVAYAMFRDFSFRTDDGTAKSSASRFVCAAVASWLLSVTLVTVLSTMLPPAFAKIGADGVTFCVNFLVMKMWVFRSHGRS